MPVKCVYPAAEKKTADGLSHEEIVSISLAASGVPIVVCSMVIALHLRHRRHQSSSSSKMKTCQTAAFSAYDALSPTTKDPNCYD
ncbi:hypothetical protein DPMN_066465 [Dreissena polymorpha]|uniref:Uncharacterized protein n=1 Tax=Dreissena polymorpha TaxID=45954 RepID=A0A9D3YTJ2_DREPO|nr:hypothetical protein DPMN_066465 [Dreissena polymorpha]